ncbi:MAG: hopanoid biosynthesis-associated protein HpnK [Gammaproteobacteria bacterium]
MGAGERRLKQLIATADDFGLSIPVNEAVEAAHRNGILTSASLMVTAAATQDAVARARTLPDLAVGLHLVLVDGNPCLPVGVVPALVDRHGLFSKHLASAGCRFFFLPAVRRQLEAEIRAQFQTFLATGLALDHVNSHHHMHLHPTVLGLILKIGREYGLKAIRFPFEPPGHTGGNEWPHRVLAPWLALMKNRIAQAGIHRNHQIFGLRESGGMNSERLLAILQRLPDGITEVFFHPATRRWPGLEAGAEQYHYEQEYQALIDPRIAEAVRQSGVRLIAFRDL